MTISELSAAARGATVPVLPPKGLNTSFYLDLNSFSRQTAWAHAFMHAYALWLGPVLLAVIFVAVYAVLWWDRHGRAVALLFLGGLGTLAALGLNQLVGHAAGELRPYATHPHALVLVGKTSDYSFPSDHSVLAGGLTVAVLLVLFAGARHGARHGAGRAGSQPAGAAGTSGAGTSGALAALTAASVVLGLFLCFARVYVGAHYPGDVVAGYLLAALVVALVSLLRPVSYLLF